MRNRSLPKRGAGSARPTGIRRAAAVGCDCLGLIRGRVGRVIGAPAPARPYAPRLGRAGRRERLIEAAEAHCGGPRRLAEARPATFVIFPLAPGAAAKHAGILRARTASSMPMNGGCGRISR